MKVPVISAQEVTFHAGFLPRREVRRILDSYGNTVTWSEFGNRLKSEFTIELDCEKAWSARDDIAEFFEAWNARR